MLTVKNSIFYSQSEPFFLAWRLFIKESINIYPHNVFEIFYIYPTHPTCLYLFALKNELELHYPLLRAGLFVFFT